MGDARRRGAFEARKAEALRVGRVRNQRARKSEPTPSAKQLFAALESLLGGKPKNVEAAK